MLKRFLDGLIFGAGFALAFVVLYSLWMIWVWPVMIESRYRDSNVVGKAPEVEESLPPEISDNIAYLGSIGSYSGDFVRKGKVLAEGPGLIVGRAEVSDKPAAGLKLRLALNGEVMSQWAIVDENGNYTIPVPYGEYRIDGHELDLGSCNQVLAGKINHPAINPFYTVFTVSEASMGEGPDFQFIDPVQPNLPKKQFLLSEDVIVSWHSYPGASQYRIQIDGSPDYKAFGKYSSLFGWDNRPIVTETSINLGKLDVELKAGHYYTVDIEALDGESKVISRTAWNRSGYDFRVE